ncbi:MAG: hypothetical protein AAFX50_11300 [Acidobacteriota bacterium]
MSTKIVLLKAHIELGGDNWTSQFMKFTLIPDRDLLDTNNLGIESKLQEKGLFSGKIDWEVIPEKTMVFHRQLIEWYRMPDDVPFLFRMKDTSRADDNLEFTGRVHVASFGDILGAAHGEVSKGSGSWTLNGSWAYQGSDATDPSPIVVGG